MPKKKKSSKHNDPNTDGGLDPPSPFVLVSDYQPVTSPYASSIAGLVIGEERTQFIVFSFLVDKYPKILDRWDRQEYIDSPGARYDLHDVDGDVGHTLVHFLYTGRYQTLSTPGLPDEKNKIEYGRAFTTYIAARVYEMPALASLAQNQIQSLTSAVEYPFTISHIKDAFASGLSDDEWLCKYLEGRIETYFDGPESMFGSKYIVSHIGSVPDFDKAVVNYFELITYRGNLGSRSSPPGTASTSRSEVDHSPPNDEQADPGWDVPPADADPPPAPADTVEPAGDVYDKEGSFDVAHPSLPPPASPVPAENDYDKEGDFYGDPPPPPPDEPAPDDEKPAEAPPNDYGLADDVGLDATKDGSNVPEPPVDDAWSAWGLSKKGKKKKKKGRLSAPILEGDGGQYNVEAPPEEWT